MYRITIDSVYTGLWEDVYTNKKAMKAAFASLFKEMIYGETITVYNPAGTMIKQKTR